MSREKMAIEVLSEEQVEVKDLIGEFLGIVMTSL